MLVNKANLNEIYRNLNASFQRAFEAAPMQWKKIAMLVPSSSSRNDYSWVQYFPRMREWIGEKVIKSLAGQNYVIDNRDWEATIEVDRNDIEDDQLGIYRPQAEGAGYSAAQLPDEIVFEQRWCRFFRQVVKVYSIPIKEEYRRWPRDDGLRQPSRREWLWRRSAETRRCRNWQRSIRCIRTR